MKTIIRNENNISHYVFDDSVDVIFEDLRILTPYFIIGDLNSSNATLIEGIGDVPDDWENEKYLYDQSSEQKWTLNPDWVEPETIIQAEE